MNTHRNAAIYVADKLYDAVVMAANTEEAPDALAVATQAFNDVYEAPATMVEIGAPSYVIYDLDRAPFALRGDCVDRDRG